MSMTAIPFTDLPEKRRKKKITNLNRLTQLLLLLPSTESKTQMNNVAVL